jgi:hypothetical protein
VIVLIVSLAAAAYAACQNLPTNQLVRGLRQRPTGRAAAGALLLGVTYFVAGAWCAEGVASGGPGWLNLGVLLFWWNALKLISHALLAVIRGMGRAGAGARVPPVLGDGVDAGAERGRGVSLPAEIGGGRRR